MISKLSNNYSSVSATNYSDRRNQPLSFKANVGKTDKFEPSRSGKKKLSKGAIAAILAGITLAIAAGVEFILYQGKYVKSTSDKLKGDEVMPEVKTEVEQPTKHAATQEVNTEDEQQDNPEEKTEVNPKGKQQEEQDATTEFKPEVERTKETDMKPEGEPVVEQPEVPEEKPVSLKEQLDSELKEFANAVPDMSRSELAKIRYNLSIWGSELDKLETLKEKEMFLVGEDQLRLDFLRSKLELVKQREKEIEEALKPFHPGDTVTKNSAVSKHHEANGFNGRVRFAVKARSKNMEGLSEEDAQEVLSTEKLMKKMDEEFEQLPPIEHDCIVYKGAAENGISKKSNRIIEVIDNAEVGDIVVPDTAYTYTAFERSIAECWGGEGARHVSTKDKPLRVMMCEIHLPKGAKVSRNWEHKGEVLMPRGAQYKVLDKKVAENGDIDVTLEYILPEA